MGQTTLSVVVLPQPVNLIPHGQKLRSNVFWKIFGMSKQRIVQSLAFIKGLPFYRRVRR